MNAEHRCVCGKEAVIEMRGQMSYKALPAASPEVRRLAATIGTAQSVTKLCEGCMTAFAPDAKGMVEATATTVVRDVEEKRQS